MKLTFDSIINRHKGEKCLVIGHGPSLNNYSSKLTELKNNGYFIIGCNNWNEFYPECPPHYWTNANTADNCQNLLSLINQYKASWIYADSVDTTDQEWLEKNILVDFLSV